MTERRNVIVITRNGRTTVYSGWRAWAMMAVVSAGVLLLLALFATLVLGFALTFGAILLLALPTMILVALIAQIFAGRPR
jgi:hypothetical protein